MARETILFPADLVSALNDVAHPMLISSPAFLKRALAVLDLDDLDARLRGIFSSGGPLPPGVAAAYNQALSHPIVEVYGSTETGGIGYRTVMMADEPSPWSPLPGVGLAVAPDSGVLMVASPFLPRSGWHRTGDLVDLLPDGRFVLRGRADRIVKVEERRVSLVELERRLGESPDVAAVRVLRLAAGDRGRASLGAVVVPTSAGWDRLCADGKEALKASLLAALRPHCDPAALPRRWRFVRGLPESAQGKTSEAELAGLFASERDNVWPVVLDWANLEDGFRLTFRLPPDLRFFEGHFDGAPILAGVVQLEWAIRFAKERFAIAAPVHRIEALKFISVMRPGALVTLDLRYDDRNQRLHFRYGSNERDCSGGRIVFGASP